MPGPVFEFFEMVADELSTASSKVITFQNLQVAGKNLPLLDSLIKDTNATGVQDVIARSVDKLQKHFESKGGKMPFDYDPQTGRFTTTDSDFLGFINTMNEIRSNGKRSRDFECTVAKKLGERATGAVHRVGHPRDKRKKRSAFNRYLKTLGFNNPVAYGHDKDGGLDILWVLPLGGLPHKPMVSVQCKNGEFSLDEALKSVGVASGSFARHAGLQSTVCIPCVLFNDYICTEMLNPRPMNFVPLGLTDLAALNRKSSVSLI